MIRPDDHGKTAADRRAWRLRGTIPARADAYDWHFGVGTREPWLRYRMSRAGLTMPYR